MNGPRRQLGAMRNVFWLLGLAALAVALALLTGHNQAMVSLFWPPYRFDVSFNFVLFCLVAGFVLLYLALRALSMFRELPRQAQRWRLAFQFARRLQSLPGDQHGPVAIGLQRRHLRHGQRGQRFVRAPRLQIPMQVGHGHIDVATPQRIDERRRRVEQADLHRMPGAQAKIVRQRLDRGDAVALRIRVGGDHPGAWRRLSGMHRNDVQQRQEDSEEGAGHPAIRHHPAAACRVPRPCRHWSRAGRRPSTRC